MSEHMWTENDDKVAFYLYKFDNGAGVEAWAHLLGMTPDSMKMRIGNFKAIDGEGGLSHFAKQSKEIYDKYHKIQEPAFRKELLKIVEGMLFHKK